MGNQISLRPDQCLVFSLGFFVFVFVFLPFLLMCNHIVVLIFISLLVKDTEQIIFVLNCHLYYYFCEIPPLMFTYVLIGLNGFLSLHLGSPLYMCVYIYYFFKSILLLKYKNSLNSFRSPKFSSVLFEKFYGSTFKCMNHFDLKLSLWIDVHSILWMSNCSCTVIPFSSF
jgi:hypothetical protein